MLRAPQLRRRSLWERFTATDGLEILLVVSSLRPDVYNLAPRKRVSLHVLHCAQCRLRVGYALVALRQLIEMGRERNMS